MSSISNIPYTTRSVNGIITLSDGVAQMQNGALTNLTTLDTDNITTQSFATNDFVVNTNIDLTADTSKIQFLYGANPNNTVIDRFKIDTTNVFADNIYGDLSGNVIALTGSFSTSLTAPTVSLADNSLNVATTEWVKAQGYSTGGIPANIDCSSITVINDNTAISQISLNSNNDNANPTIFNVSRLSSSPATNDKLFRLNVNGSRITGGTNYNYDYGFIDCRIDDEANGWGGWWFDTNKDGSMLTRMHINNEKVHITNVDDFLISATTQMQIDSPLIEITNAYINQSAIPSGQKNQFKASNFTELFIDGTEITAGLLEVETLAQVLAAGNSAGSYNINMNNQEILNCSKIYSTNIYGDLCGNVVASTGSFSTSLTAPTVALSDNSLNVATTAWVKSQGYGVLPSNIDCSSISIINDNTAVNQISLNCNNDNANPVVFNVVRKSSTPATSDRLFRLSVNGNRITGGTNYDYNYGFIDCRIDDEPNGNGGWWFITNKNGSGLPRFRIGATKVEVANVDDFDVNSTNMLINSDIITIVDGYFSQGTIAGGQRNQFKTSNFDGNVFCNNGTLYITRGSGSLATDGTSRINHWNYSTSTESNFISEANDLGTLNYSAGIGTPNVNKTGTGYTNRNSVVSVGGYANFALTTGNQNTSVGVFAGRNTTTGSQNVNLGLSAGDNITTGSSNTCIGTGAGNNSTFSNNMQNCTFLGASSVPSVSNLQYATCVGSGVSVDISNCVQIGRSADTVNISGAFRPINTYLALTTNTSYATNRVFLGKKLVITSNSATTNTITLPNVAIANGYELVIANTSNTQCIISSNANINGKFGTGTTTMTLYGGVSLTMYCDGTNYIVFGYTGLAQQIAYRQTGNIAFQRITLSNVSYNATNNVSWASRELTQASGIFTNNTGYDLTLSVSTTYTWCNKANSILFNDNTIPNCNGNRSTWYLHSNTTTYPKFLGTNNFNTLTPDLSFAFSNVGMYQNNITYATAVANFVLKNGENFRPQVFQSNNVSYLGSQQVYLLSTSQLDAISTTITILP